MRAGPLLGPKRPDGWRAEERRPHSLVARYPTRVGSLNHQTLDKQAAETACRAFLQAHHQRIWTALEAACGSFVLMRRTKDGVVQVTDPEEMARLLAEPPPRGRDQQWYLEVRRPDPTLMKALHHRLIGRPTQLVESSGTEPLRVRIVQHME